MTTKIIAYDNAINLAAGDLKTAYSDRIAEIRQLLKRQIMHELERIADNEIDKVIERQELTTVDKKNYQESFKVTVFDDAVHLDFNPKTPQIAALEYGASAKSVNEAMLSKNYKMSKDGHKYKVIPIQSKEPLDNAVGFHVREIKAGIYDEEQFFKSMMVLIKGQEREAGFEITAEREGVFDYRSIPMRVQIAQKDGTVTQRQRRIYISKPRGQHVESVSRYTVFRTVSDKPGAHQWRQRGIEDGFQGLGLAEQISNLYDEIITSYAKALVERVLA